MDTVRSMEQPGFRSLKEICSGLLHWKTAHCETKVVVVPVHTVKRADSEKLRQIFEKYVSVTRQGDKFMTLDDFVRKFLRLYPDENFDPDTVQLLGSVADTSKDGLISFAEFQAFEAVLCLPDALYMTAFSLFDTNGSGMCSFTTVNGMGRKAAELWYHASNRALRHQWRSHNTFYDMPR